MLRKILFLNFLFFLFMRFCFSADRYWPGTFISTKDLSNHYHSGINYFTGNYTLNNDWVIDSARAVTLSLANVSIADNKAITVKSGCSLTIHASNLHACAGMWAGIIVKPGGVLIIQSASAISDAVTAITSTGVTTQSTTIRIINSSLTNDNTGVDISNSNFGSASLSFTFYGNTVSCITATLTKSPFNGQ